MTIPFTSIIEGDRARSAKKYGELAGLKSSIEEIGLIQCIAVSKRPATDKEQAIAHEGSVYDLIAGGRRYRCMKQLKTTELHHGVLLDPTRLGFVFADEVPEHTRKEAELDENLHRLEMDWIDSALLVSDIHAAKRKNAQANGQRWGERQTAALLGKGYGKSNVNYAIRIAEKLRSGDTEMLACENMSDAIALMIKRKEDEALAELQRRTLPKAQVLPSPTDNTGTSSFLDTLNISQGPAKVLPGVEGEGKIGALDRVTALLASAPKVQPTIVTAKVEVPLSGMFWNGDFRAYPSIQWSGMFDHIVTDIPYGIDMDNLDEKQVADVKDQHDVIQNVGMMETFLQFAFAAVRPGGFCVFFYDLDHHEKLQGWAKAAGWREQRWPYIAAKSSACQNNAAQYNTTKNYEVAMFLRKDEKTVLRRTISTSWKSYDFAAERRLYNNPFAKPFELWKDIYDAIAFPGQTVLDPFCGEMSSCRAAANCGLTPYGIEIKESHFNRGLEHMRAVYALIHKSNVIFT